MRNRAKNKLDFQVPVELLEQRKVSRRWRGRETRRIGGSARGGRIEGIPVRPLQCQSSLARMGGGNAMEDS